MEQEIVSKTKGFMDVANVCLTNKKFRNITYDCDEMKPCDKLEFKNKTTFFIMPFFKALKFLKSLDVEGVSLSTESNRLIMSAEDEMNRVKVDLSLIEPTDTQEGTRAKYSIKYLLDFLKEYKTKQLETTNEACLEFNTNYPLRMSLGEDWMILAPRVEY